MGGATHDFVVKSCCLSYHGIHSMRQLPFLFSSVLVAGLFLASIAARGESNWPGWRGPQQDGHSSETDLPVKWSAEDVLWKTQLPGVGQSSPIIWGDRIFLTSALEKGKERLVFCVDRKSGQI